MSDEQKSHDECLLIFGRFRDTTAQWVKELHNKIDAQENRINHLEKCLRDQLPPIEVNVLEDKIVWKDHAEFGKRPIFPDAAWQALRSEYYANKEKMEARITKLENEINDIRVLNCERWHDYQKRILQIEAFISQNYEQDREMFNRFVNVISGRVQDLEMEKLKVSDSRPLKTEGMTFVEAMQANSKGKKVRLDRKSGNIDSYIILGKEWWTCGTNECFCKDDFLSNDWRVIDD